MALNNRRSSTSWLSKISLEPVMFFHMVGVTTMTVMGQNLYLERICTHIHNYTEEICKNLSQYPVYEKQVEDVAATYSIYRNILEGAFPLIISLFLGPWTDRFGSKLPLLISISGFLLSSIMYTIVSLNGNLPPWTLLLCSIPIGLSGGMVVIILCVFSFISQNTTESNRSFRIALVDGAWWLGAPLGLLLGAAIYKHFDGIPPVFVATVAAYSLALISGIYFMAEDLPLTSFQAHAPVSCANFKPSQLFNVKAVQEVFATAFREREGSRRSWILILVASLNLNYLSWLGCYGVLYLFTRNQLGWDAIDYSTFAVVDSILGVIGLFVMALIALKWLRLSDPVVGLLSSVFILLSSLLLTFANASWMIYFASVVQMPAMLLSTAVRSLLSKCVGKSELGKIFSFLASAEALMPLCASPLYNLVYEYSLHTHFQGAVFLLSVCLSMIMTLLFMYLNVMYEHFQSFAHQQIDTHRIYRPTTMAKLEPEGFSRGSISGSCGFGVGTGSESDEEDEDDFPIHSSFDHIDLISIVDN